MLKLHQAMALLFLNYRENSIVFLSFLLVFCFFLRFESTFSLMVEVTLLRKLIHAIAYKDDAAAYKELFLLYHKRLLNFSITITHSKESSEEVVSDVFMKIWLNRKVLPAIENFHLYIYIATKNLSINKILKERKQGHFSLQETIIDVKNIYEDPEQLMITSEMQKRIRSVIQALPPKCRLIFKLIREDGLKYKEVAELLNLSLKTVENQMTIAIKKISDSIRFDIVRTMN
jgi:RNA polymerase sigma-70 factor (family 1)